MTRALVGSDFHIDIPHNGYAPRDVDCDIVIVAGDVQQPLSRSLKWLRTAWPNHPIIYVPGNHDYYSHFDKHQPDLKTTYQRERENAPHLAQQLEITLLDNASCVLPDGTRVLGTTLWTDFLNRPPYMSFEQAVRDAMRMNDYRCIKVSEGRSKDTFKPKDSIAAHKVAVKWLTAELKKPHDGGTIVISHHQPMPTPGKPLEHLDHCYSSATLGHLFEDDNAPSLWIHGHVHRNADHMIGNTRVLANPRGYPMSFMKNAPRENPHFDPELVIEIGRELTPRMGM